MGVSWFTFCSRLMNINVLLIQGIITPSALKTSRRQVQNTKDGRKNNHANSKYHRSLAKKIDDKIEIFSKRPT